LLKELGELLDIAYDEIQKNIQEKLEILFLPYQVSMWDSLESVWMAAKERGDLDCYVVPIPYYDVLPDNSLGNIHYEGDKYPDYVPVTSYLKYSIEARRPDVIFFHDPYDEFNRVTRIPEQFYSKNLKKYTDMLVYIPYFVSEEGGPAEYQCYTSGVLFADRVIVQPGISQTDGMMICWDEKRNNIMTSIDLSHESGKKEMTYATCFYANGIVYIPEKNGTCILELDVKESLLVSYECKDIPGFKMNGQGNQAFGEHIRIGDDGAVYFFPLRANGVVVKTKAGCVHFYKSETVNGLGIAADQQIQNENTCTLNHFYKKLELENKRIIYESNVGLNIVRDICKTS